MYRSIKRCIFWNTTATPLKMFKFLCHNNICCINLTSPVTSVYANTRTIFNKICKRQKMRQSCSSEYCWTQFHVSDNFRCWTWDKKLCASKQATDDYCLTFSTRIDTATDTQTDTQTAICAAARLQLTHRLLQLQNSTDCEQTDNHSISHRQAQHYSIRNHVSLSLYSKVVYIMLFYYTYHHRRRCQHHIHCYGEMPPHNCSPHAATKIWRLLLTAAM